MKVLIYGGLGFIGANVVEEFKDVEAYVAHRPGSLHKKPEIAQFVAQYGRLVEYRDPAAPLSAVKPEVLVNLVGEYFGPSHVLREANAEFPKALCQAARSVGWRGKVIHISAATVRGPVAPVITEEERHLVGAAPATDFDRYKAEGEKTVATCFDDWVIIRPVIVYGRFNDHPEWVALAKMAKRGFVPTISARLSTISARELAKAVRRSSALTREYFFATECAPRPLSDFAKAMASAMGKKPLALPVPTALLKLAAPPDLKKHMAFLDKAFSCEKMKGLLGWAPQPDFQREVAEMAQYILQRHRL